MMRHPDWHTRLHALLRDSAQRPYAYGEHDCLLFAADVAKAVTGKDHARGHRRKYKSLAGAYRHLQKAFGVDSPEALLDKLFREKKVGFAAEGDLVLCHVDEAAGPGDAPVAGDVPGVCVGAFALVAGETGLERVPRGGRWLKAWTIGDHHSGEIAHP